MLRTRYTAAVLYLGALIIVIGLVLQGVLQLIPAAVIALGFMPFAVIPLLLARQRELDLRNRVQFVQERLDYLWEIQAAQYRAQRLSNVRFNDPKRLSRRESKVYSQAGEDGMLREVFHRIGTSNKVFVEFGIGSGSENNTVFLLRHQKWSGLWMDGNPAAERMVRKQFASDIESNRLTFAREFITPSNIEGLFKTYGIPEQFDLLSIDVDGNDYWIWKAITHYRPRVLVLEYNAIYPPGVEAVMPYDPTYEHEFGSPWETSSHWGASLTSWQTLNDEKGYSLVGCNIDGVDAIFVRNDLLGDHFCSPYTAENHYEQPMYPSQWSKHGAYRRQPL